VRLRVANGDEHRPLADACLVKDLLLAALQHAPTVRAITDMEYLSPLVSRRIVSTDVNVFRYHASAAVHRRHTGLVRYLSGC